MKITVQTIDIALTTQTLGSLCDWMISSPPLEMFTNMQFKANFLTTLTSPSQPLAYVYEIIRNAKKSPVQLYNILKDNFIKNRGFKFSLALSAFTLGMIESNFKNDDSNANTIRILLENINYEIAQPDFIKSEEGYHKSFRNNFLRDNKFYQEQQIKISSVNFDTRDLESMNNYQHIIQFKLDIKIKQCLMKYHPNLPEMIIDCHLDYLKIYIRKEVVTLLGLMSTMNFSHNNSQMSEDKYERNKLERSILE